MKLNINGYARHGKDTVADLFVKYHGLRKTSASMIYAKEIRESQFLGPYASDQECYEDRVNHRKEWYDFIRHRSSRDPSYYVRKTLEKGDIYVGHRSLPEYKATRPLFDATIWVDASRRGLPEEDESSCKLSPSVPHDFYIDNGGEIIQTLFQVDAIVALIKNRKRAQDAY